MLLTQNEDHGGKRRQKKFAKNVKLKFASEEHITVSIEHGKYKQWNKLKWR